MLLMVDNLKEITVKKSCKYGEYGSFEHLLFFFTNCLNIVKIYKKPNQVEKSEQ